MWATILIGLATNLSDITIQYFIINFRIGIDDKTISVSIHFPFKIPFVYFILSRVCFIWFHLSYSNIRIYYFIFPLSRCIERKKKKQPYSRLCSKIMILIFFTLVLCCVFFLSLSKVNVHKSLLLYCSAIARIIEYCFMTMTIPIDLQWILWNLN